MVDDFYLDHFSPESGKGIDIAHGIYKRVCGTELENRLSLVKADGTNVNTDSLSTDQYYAYLICCSIITGDVDDDLALLEVGPINHSRWLTLACRILRYYASLVKPSKNLKMIAEFILVPHKG
ncbi:hypothetical protein Anas_14505 [Armadillidium nasatum]|uniref:Uncharacterized protein n=1 Tax=Armadillidium nasatum TaxID=96803 RepID=A0A5N5T0D7_9CRUS|nr:hypothetical protein Anas_14505 [Armadillidium nasatum]